MVAQQGTRARWTDGWGAPAPELVIARNPDDKSRLPVLLRLPVEDGPQVVLATRETWPGRKDLFCFELTDWPQGSEILERVPVERCWRAGAAVHLMLRRRQHRRSIFVWTQRQGRTLIFWRSRTSMRAARPGIRIPAARGLEDALEVAVDIRERYPWRFARSAVTTRRRELPVGDYAVLDGERCVAAVERKTVADLARSVVAGELALVLAELSRVPHGALVVEGRLSDLVKAGQEGGMRPGRVINLVAALQVASPRVAWMFAETRSLAEDYAYRWLSACAQAEHVVRPAQVGDAAKAGPELLDAVRRQQIAREEAARGTVWTTTSFAARCRVSQMTAWKDLEALRGEGLLVADAVGRGRRYRAPDGPASPT